MADPGVATSVVVSSTLSEEKIVVADDASCLAGDEVDGPLLRLLPGQRHRQAHQGHHRRPHLCRARPRNQTARPRSTPRSLQASLFTSVVAFGVAFMAFGFGSCSP